MAVDRTTPIFFDASCLFAAADSPLGGSGFLIDLCYRALLAGVVSDGVLAEAARRIAQKRPHSLPRYEAMMRAPGLGRVAVSPAESRTFVDLVGSKDAHVLAAALVAGAAYLITLDKPLARRVNGAQLPIQALAPGDFIRLVLPSHPDFPTIR